MVTETHWRRAHGLANSFYYWFYTSSTMDSSAIKPFPRDSPVDSVLARGRGIVVRQGEYTINLMTGKWMMV